MNGDGLALLGGKPVCGDYVFPRDRPVASADEFQAAERCISSGGWSMFTSPDVQEFEERLSEAVGATETTFVNSGTSAIHAALLSLDLPPRPRVGVPAYTYVGTCTPVSAIGGEPVFLDVEGTTLSLDPDALDREVRASGALDAVVMAHLFGAAGRAADVARLCSEHGTALVHDCAQLFGNRRATSALAFTGPCCFSFGESKILRLGEGGAVATNSPALAQRVRMARHQGEAWLGDNASRSSDQDRSAFDALARLCSIRVGLNFRPPAITASVGLARLRRMPDELEARSRNATLLLAALEGSAYLRPLNTTPDVWWTLPVLVADGLDRNVILAALLAEGVPAGVHFPRLIPEHPLYSGTGQQRDHFPNAEAFSRRHLVLPIYPALGVSDIEAIVSALQKVGEHLSMLGAAGAGVADRFLRGAVLEELCQGIFYFLAKHDLGP